ncbi:MAG: GNAT family N-acetyltransferase [Candidatus Poribacteria bacterium]
MSENRNFVFRKATKNDAENIFRVLVSAFQLIEGDYKWKNMRGLAYGGTENFLVLCKDEKIIGTAMISPHWLRVGSVNVLKGDVGEVAILSELQGQGYGTKLMQECVKYLSENGFHLSRLGGLVRFYSRFGYVPFPRRYYEFLLTDVRAGASKISADRLIKLSPEHERNIRLYHPIRDWQARNNLYDDFNKNRTGSLVEWRGSSPPTSGEPNPNALSFVYDEGGQVLGYLFAGEYPYEPSPFEAKVTIYDVAFDINRPYAFTSLMAWTLRESIKHGAQRVTARLPFDPIIQKLLVDAELSYSLQELQSSIASNMMLILDLKGLVKAIIPELLIRIMNFPNFTTFSVQLLLNDQKVTLKISDKNIKIDDNENADTHLTCDMTAFLRWLFGINSFDEWQIGVRHSFNQEQSMVFAKLFPRLPCASGIWG